jgi:hypothetical protein
MLQPTLAMSSTHASRALTKARGHHLENISRQPLLSMNDSRLPDTGKEQPHLPSTPLMVMLLADLPGSSQSMSSLSIGLSIILLCYRASKKDIVLAFLIVSSLLDKAAVSACTLYIFSTGGPTVLDPEYGSQIGRIDDRQYRTLR